MRALIYGLYFLIISLCFFLSSYQIYSYIVITKHKNKNQKYFLPEQFKKIEKDLGNITDETRGAQRRHFWTIPQKKKPGVIRIGIFGGSIVYGAETLDRADISSQLQEIFHDQGIQNVEVINFGVIHGGMAHVYYLWKNLNEKFSLDLSIVGFGSFMRERVTSFSNGEILSDSVHPKYIVEGEHLREIQISGDSKLEKLQNYYNLRTIPFLLKFDRRPPLALSFLSDQGKKYIKALYYTSKNGNAEARETMSLMLAKMSEKSPLVLFPFTYELSKLKRTDTISKYLETDTLFPYFLRAHHSSLGNRKIAEKIYTHLTGQKIKSKASKRLRISTNEILSTAGKQNKLDRIELESIDVIFDEMVVGGLRHSDRFLDVDKISNSLKNKTLLLGKAEGLNFLDMPVLAIPQGDWKYLRIGSGEKIKIQCNIAIQPQICVFRLGKSDLARAWFEISTRRTKGRVYSINHRVKCRRKSNIMVVGAGGISKNVATSKCGQDGNYIYTFERKSFRFFPTKEKFMGPNKDVSKVWLSFKYVGGVTRRYFIGEWFDSPNEIDKEIISIRAILKRSGSRAFVDSGKKK